MSKAAGSKTTRETYSRLIGYNFGSDAQGHDRIYNGAYWDPDTGKKQYEFIYCDRSGKVVAQEIMNYKNFRAIIDQYDWPRR